VYRAKPTQVAVLPYPQARGGSVGAAAGGGGGQVYPKPVSEKSPGAQGGGYGGDKEGQWRGGDAKKRWDRVGDKWTGEKSRGGESRGGGARGGGSSGGKSRNSANTKRQDMMNAHMGI